MTGIRLAHDWYPAPLPRGVSIGDGSWLYSSWAFRHCRSTRPSCVRIGRHSGVYDGTCFHLGSDGEVEIGDWCAIVGAVVCTNQRLEVHDYAFVAHEVVFADHAFAAPFDAAAPRGVAAAAGGPGIVLGENCWIGMRAVLLAGARIGRDAIVGAGAVVDFDVPDGAVVTGNPATIHRGPARRGTR
jgi:acetyltransferase-like isoleucine patch superfamily enzyme